MILTFTPNPAVDKTVFIDQLIPGAKIRSQKCACVPGGKGTNVSRAAHALGYPTRAMLIVAGPTGQHVVDMIEAQDHVTPVPFWAQGLTRTITTVLEEPVHRQTAIFEPGPSLSADEIERLIALFEASLQDAKVVTMNGAVQHDALRPLYHRLVECAHDAAVLPIVDSYGPEFALALDAKPYMVKPNIEEAEGLVGFPLDSLVAQRRAIDCFHAKGIQLVVLSLGKDGALVSRDGECLRVIPPVIHEVNAVGSGDALVAGFAIGLHEDWPLEKMARLGVAAGAANAMSWDIGHFTPEEVANMAKQVRVERC
jgi:1-phosphofructokinase family hexose kinase